MEYLLIFFIKNLNVDNIYCFEPHFLFIEKLKELKKNSKISKFLIMALVLKMKI